jgi:hypothetical protein
MTYDYSLYRYTDSDGYFLGYYKPIEIPMDVSDYIIEIEPKYENKPKSLALELYGNTELSWIFAYFNKNVIEDPIFDLKSGMKIIVPTKERLMQYF